MQTTRKLAVTNDLINPLGELTAGAPVGWEFDSASGLGTFAYSEVTDDDLGACLQVVYTPHIALDFCLMRLRNGDTNGTDDLTCKPTQMQYTRVWVKAISGAPSVGAMQYEHAFAGVVALTGQILRQVDLPENVPVEVEGAEAAVSFWVRPLIYVNPTTNAAVTFRIKAQHVSEVWGDVPEFVTDPEDVTTTLPLGGFNDLTFSNLGYSAFDPAEDFTGVTLTENTEINRRLGATAIRSWSGDYPGDPTTYDHSLRGEWMDEMRRAGLKFLPIVYVPDAIPDLLDRWGDIIIGVEVENEPNIEPSAANPDPSAYTDRLQLIYEAVKARDRHMPVIGGALAAGGQTDLLTGSFRRMRPYSFLTDMLDAGAGDYMDAVSVHPYPFDATTAKIPGTTNYGDGMWGNVEQVRLALSEHDLSMPIYITEIGYDPLFNDDVAGPKGKRMQAQLVPLMRGMLGRHPEIEAVFVHSLWRESATDGFGALTYPGKTYTQLAGLLAGKPKRLVATH